MPSLSAKFNVGSGNVSALIKSATSTANAQASYEDELQSLNFQMNPGDAQYQQYSNYLQSRINSLQSSSSYADQSKALSLVSKMNAAMKTNTSFNIQNESIQILAGNATDQQKLDYIGTAYQRAASVGDVSLAQSLESQAYNLQQSIAIQQQTSQTAAATQATANATAVKAGYENVTKMIDGEWNSVLSSFKNGNAGAVNQALSSFVKNNAATFKQYGIQIPTGGQLTMASLAQAVMNAKIESYVYEANALGGTSTAEGQAAFQKAQDYQNGVSTIKAPNGQDFNIHEIGQWVAADPRLYSTSTDVTGKTTMNMNQITGYQATKVQEGFKIVNGQLVPNYKAEAVPTTSGTVQTGKAGSNLTNKLQSLGFNIKNNLEGGQIKVQLTDKTASWMGTKNPNLRPGNEVTLVVTNGGKGFQFLDSNGVAHGLSFDSMGRAGLYSMDANTGKWNAVQGQTGFNAATTNQSNLSTIGQAVSNINNSFSNPQPGKPKMVQRAGGGFNFTDAQGRAISAATYSMQTGVAFRTLLTQMSNGGDAGARTVLGFVGNDYGYDPTKINSSNAGLYNSLVWGTGKAAPQGPQTSGGQLKLPSGLKL